MNRAAVRAAPATRYIYSANRLKYPLVRKRLVELWREALAQHSDPVDARGSIVTDPVKAAAIKRRAATAVLSAPTGAS